MTKASANRTSGLLLILCGFFSLAENEILEPNLIMPEPCPFLDPSFPICSIVRPTQTKGAAMGAAMALANDGLFIGQTPEFFQLLTDLATDADQARRE